MTPAIEGVTVAIPTLDRTDCLIDTISDLLVQTYTPMEILVVDQSTEPAPKVLQFIRDHAQAITYCHSTVKGLPNARNFAWQKALYPLIIFVDDDIRCGREFVKEHVASHFDDSIGAVAGGIDEQKAKYRPAKKSSYNFWTATGTRAYSTHGVFAVDHVPGGNFSVLRSTIKLAGGFDERLNYGAALYEETEFSLRLRKAGKKILFNGNARLTHLAVKNGGCRVRDIEKYTRALIHNRCILIFRYSRWYQVPVALIRLGILILSYTWSYKKLSILINFPDEAQKGIADACSLPRVTFLS